MEEDMETKIPLNIVVTHLYHFIIIMIHVENACLYDP